MTRRRSKHSAGKFDGVDEGFGGHCNGKQVVDVLEFHVFFVNLQISTRKTFKLSL